jgi:O-antigen/teichoic acid export membrane protein
MVGNLAAYVLALVAARRIGPSGFGELSALLAVVIVLAVLPTGIQTVIARAVAADRPHPLASLNAGRLLAISGGLSVLALAPVLAVGWYVSAPLAASVCVAALVAPLCVLGWAQGLSQGREQLGRLGVLLMVNNGGRAAGALVGVLVWGTSTAALAGALVSASVGAWWALASARATAAQRQLSLRAAARETLAASAALLALFLCSSADVVLARGRLDAASAGVYAAGAIMAKISFWLPQFAAVTALPRLVDPTRRRAALRASLAIVAVSTAALVLATLVLPGTIVSVIGDRAYEDLTDPLPLFALAGGLWALNQVMLFDALARRSRFPAGPLWMALSVLVVAAVALRFDSVTSLIVAVVGCAGGSLLVYGVAAWRSQLTVASGQGPGTNSAL